VGEESGPQDHMGILCHARRACRVG